MNSQAVPPLRRALPLPLPVVSEERARQLKALAVNSSSVALSPRALDDLEMLLSGAYAPLEGFLSRRDYECVLADMHLADGRFWPMPVCLDIDAGMASTLVSGETLALRDGEGFMLAVLHVEDVWQPDLEREARAVYGEGDLSAHPEAQALLERRGVHYVAGRLEGLHLPVHVDFNKLRLRPGVVRQDVADSGWLRVLGARLHGDVSGALRASLLQAAKAVGGSILALSAANTDVLGGDDHFAATRCLRAFGDSFPPDILRLGLLPGFQRMAGPRQALLDACVFGNFGCTHFFVPSRYADPAREEAEPFYPLGEARRQVEAASEAIGVVCVQPEEMAYLEARAQFVPAAELPPRGGCAASLNTAELKRRLEFGLEIPEWYTPAAVAQELRQAHPPRNIQGFTLFITGFSGAGKSTLAKILQARLMELRQRQVTLLDGDIVRKMLSSELGFSMEHRKLNIRRIGYVASEITKNGGVAICAPIAPYADARACARQMVEKYGGFIEIHLSTPIEVCIQRDRKGLYAKAKAGLIKGVTGIDDPYEVPVAPELRLDTTRMNAQETAHEVLLHLEQAGYLQ